MKSLVGELRRRNVFHMAGLYLVAAWLLVQVASTVMPLFGAPGWIARSVVILLALGFFPALLFAWVFEITPEGLKRESEVEQNASITPQTGQRMEHAIVVLLALALGYFAVDKFVLGPRREAALVASTQQAAKKAAARLLAAAQNAVNVKSRSIAVLPLANAGATDQQFFADGLSEALIVALSQFEDLKVIGRNSAFQFRGDRHDSKTIGSKLGVAHLLEGSVQHAGDAVRVSLELIDASSGRTLWSQRYDRPYKDLFKLQDEITAAVAGALKTKLLAGATPVQRDRPPSENLEAYDAYLLGKFYYARNTQQDNQRAIGQFARAVELDPSYGVAYAWLAKAWSTHAVLFVAGPKAIAHADAAIRQALVLAPDQGFVHVVHGNLLENELDWSGADAEYQRAATLAPDSGDTLFSLGRGRAFRGDLAAAVTLTRRALATDPLNAPWYRWLGVYLLAGRLDEAENAIDKALELQPDSVSGHYSRTMLWIMRGDAERAMAAARVGPPGMWRELSLMQAAQIGPDRVAADRLLQDFIHKWNREAAFQIAEAYALRRDADQAFAWVERARAVGDPGISSLFYSPPLLYYRDDPRYAAFARDIGLPWPPGSSTP